MMSRPPLSPGVNSPRQRGAGAIVLRLCGARARPREGHLRSAGTAPPALRARARRDVGRLPLLPRCPLRAAAAGGSPGAERAGPGGSRLGLSGQPLVRHSQDCALAEGPRDGPRGRGKAARASLLPGAAAAAACCSHSRRPRCGAASEGEALNGEPKAALAYLYSCSKSRRLPIHLGRFTPLEFCNESFVSPTIDAVELLAEQWENWLIQWKALNAVAKAALVSAFKATGTQAAPAFGMGGQQTSGFGLSSFPVSSSSSSTSASNFSFKASSSLISPASSGSSPAAGSSSAAANPPAFGTASSPSTAQSVGFGSLAAPSAASFSFKAAATAGAFGTSGFSGFGSASAGSSASSPAAAFGAFGATVAPSGSPSSGALFGQGGSATAHPVTSASAAATNASPASDKLFTPKSELSAEEWQQFEAKEFTIGKIPLKPPPVELLNAFDLFSLF
ncbi:nucleoporin NUP42-like [Ammospiza caudacuta]|uniref:nucleoporin NUP42-like n=1 Tax=Ammospiza caudacuta TaxID=2857398 RepID=UPI00273926DF|nr:nucleoporin NUP42-like [Ammospiza caudacuta]